jgi:AcrR family transcriptional regulator
VLVPDRSREPGPDHLGFAVPLRLRFGDGELRLLTTLTRFGTAVDVAVSELRLEAFLAADEATATALTDLALGYPRPLHIPTSRYALAAVAVGSRIASGEQTRTRLIEAAIARLAEGGPDTSFDVIAADVGVTKGALYHHFGSKEGLVEAVYKEAVRRHAERVIDASREGDGRERLQGLIASSARLYGSETPFYRLLLRLHVEAGTSRPHLAPIARRVQQRQREYMAELVAAGQADGSIRGDVDADAVGQAVNAALQGFLVQQLEPGAAQRRATEAFADLLEVLL